MAQEFTDANFKQEVESFPGLVIVDFWAPWCGPCRIQGPIVEDLAEANKGNANLRIGKMNVDANPQVSQTHGIMSIPTLKFFKNGKVAAEMIGLQSKNSIAAKIQELLK